MKRKILLIMLFTMLAFSFCSQKTEGPAENGRDAVQPRPRTRAVVAVKKTITIKSVRLTPAAPTVENDIVVLPVLADTRLENVAYQVKWFVNTKEILAAGEALLKKSNFKKNAWVYAQVKAVNPAGESPWVKSDIVQVLNARPILNLAPVPPFAAPGIFRYKINASDPDHDELTFMVIAPENEGISLEVESGLLSWKIDRETVKRLGEAIPVQFDVIDVDGGKTSGSIIVNLTKTK